MTANRAASRLASLVLGALCFLYMGLAQAASINIVALGTSNTYGRGVERNQTFPAQLQALMKARGVDARIANAGVNGDSSAGMLARLGSAVPNGTRLVLIEIHAGNEARRGVSDKTSENVAAIKARLQARGVPYLDISSTMAGYVMSGRSSPIKLPDGHLTGEGYSLVANAVLPQVMSAIGR